MPTGNADRTARPDDLAVQFPIKLEYRLGR
jgi:hypothetical protein